MAGLCEGGNEPSGSLKAICNILKTEDFKHQLNKYEEMKGLLDRLEDEVFSEWAACVPAQCERNLEKPLINQDESLELSLNFDDELVAILREVRYMKLINREGIPIEAVNLFDRVETLHQWVSNLNLSIGWYNSVRQNSLPVEFELVENEIKEIDILVKEVLDNLNWNSENVWSYVQQIRSLVEDLQNRVLKAQKNVDIIYGLINTWSLVPLFERKDGKKENLLFLDDRKERVSNRFFVKYARNSRCTLHFSLDILCLQGEILRIKRHNIIRSLLAAALRNKDLEVYEEVHCLAYQDIVRKIDIIAINREKSVAEIIDPTRKRKNREGEQRGEEEEEEGVDLGEEDMFELLEEDTAKKSSLEVVEDIELEEESEVEKKLSEVPSETVQEGQLDTTLELSKQSEEEAPSIAQISPGPTTVSQEVPQQESKSDTKPKPTSETEPETEIEMLLESSSHDQDIELKIMWKLNLVGELNWRSHKGQSGEGDIPVLWRCLTKQLWPVNSLKIATAFFIGCPGTFWVETDSHLLFLEIWRR
ncbi:hypothetical protein ANN_24918 [Periplaneta americana]|uniref:Dynein heavy chain tail domain-containing protein n=1 Tax=Periplaneta americana TaxID=6978 RepID=A0ABQ8RZZ9_PERAM|nr:hypothetical protein ANN_24918 [Periplaneta americana]